MRNIWRLTAVGVALTGLLVATPEASVEHASYLTFNEPVALPGVTLEAGTYIFDLPSHDRSLVRVSSRDRSKVFLTTFTRIVNRPPEVGSDQQITLGESPGGEVAPPVRVWYPPEVQDGREFIYRK